MADYNVNTYTPQNYPVSPQEVSAGNMQYTGLPNQQSYYQAPAPVAYNNYYGPNQATNPLQNSNMAQGTANYATGNSDPANWTGVANGAYNASLGTNPNAYTQAGLQNVNANANTLFGGMGNLLSGMANPLLQQTGAAAGNIAALINGQGAGSLNNTFGQNALSSMYNTAAGMYGNEQNAALGNYNQQLAGNQQLANQAAQQQYGAQNTAYNAMMQNAYAANPTVGGSFSPTTSWQSYQMPSESNIQGNPNADFGGAYTGLDAYNAATTPTASTNYAGQTSSPYNNSYLYPTQQTGYASGPMATGTYDSSGSFTGDGGGSWGNTVSSSLNSTGQPIYVQNTGQSFYQ